MNEDKEEAAVFGIVNPGFFQINLPAVYLANGLGVFLLTVVLYGKHRWYRSSSCDGILFRWMCRLCLVLCILDTCGFYLNGRQFSGARQVSSLCCTMIPFLGSVLAYLWVWYVDCKLFPNRQKTWKDHCWAVFPSAVIALTSLANLIFPVFFVINEENLYQRTSLFFIPWVVLYGYLVWGALLSHRYLRRTDRRMFIPVLMFLFPVSLGGLIQMLYYGISLIWVSTAVGLVCLYINLQSELVYLDSLTGLYNRAYLLHYMDRITEQSRPDQRVTGIMLDVNGFKQINDTLGHQEGDVVLQDVARILSRNAGNNTVIRYGGDEFVVLLENSGAGQVQAMLDCFRQALGEYREAHRNLPPVSFSIGTAEFDHTNVLQFLQEMDMRMYDEKRRFYRNRDLPVQYPCVCDDEKKRMPV